MVATFFKDATNLSVPNDFLIIDPVMLSNQQSKLKSLSTLLNLIKTQLVSQLETLDQVTQFRILIFCSTKETVQQVNSFLKKQNWASQCMSGDLCSQERKWLLHQYRNGDLPILVCTQIVITEGPDKELPAPSIVILFDVPKSTEQFGLLVNQSLIHSFSLAAPNDSLYGTLMRMPKLLQIKLT